MNKKLLPWLLIGGAAIAFFAFRRRPKSTVTAESPEIQTADQFEADFATRPKPSALEVGTKLVSTLFPKKTEQQKKAKAAQAAAVKRAVAKGISKKKAQAVTKQLSTFSFPRIGGDEIIF